MIDQHNRNSKDQHTNYWTESKLHTMTATSVNYVRLDAHITSPILWNSYWNCISQKPQQRRVMIVAIQRNCSELFETVQKQTETDKLTFIAFSVCRPDIWNNLTSNLSLILLSDVQKRDKWRHWKFCSNKNTINTQKCRKSNPNTSELAQVK